MRDIVFEDVKPDIFLCHSHKDKRFVRQLASDLESLSVSVWYDEWQLSVGDSLHECIGRALERSAYVGIVLSPDSVESRWCRSELEQALTREKRSGEKVALPLLRRRVSPPPFLEGRLYIDFSRSYLPALTRLAAFLHGIQPREIESRLSSGGLDSLEDVQRLVLAVRLLTPATKVLPEKYYRRIADLLKEAGIQVDSKSFEIRPADRARVLCVDEYWTEVQVSKPAKLVEALDETPAEFPPPIAQRIRKELGLESDEPIPAGRLSEITKLNLEGKPVTDDDLAHLRRLPALQILSLWGTEVTGAGLAHLKGLPALRLLDLSGRPVTDAGLRHLKELPALRELILAGTQVTDATLEHLKEFSGLRMLLLGGTQVTEAGVGALKRQIPGLEVIRGMAPLF